MLDHIDLKDKKTYAMLGRGETMGTFQLNGQGMTQYLKELEPHDIWDIMAMVALYRPGPMAFIPDYIKRKKNPNLVTYLHPELKNILKPTYGIIIYQDDVMLIAVNIAGYTWAEADKFRKAMGKKIPEMMQEQKDKFFKGCLEHGLKKETVQKLWETIETFAAYGFNKAHSASYGRVAYETSYMKANFPIEYMTALLMADSGDTEKIAEIISGCKRLGIAVLPPDINESFTDFTIVADQTTHQSAIRFGLETIKNFGEGIANAIIEERNHQGPFKSLTDFLERVQNRNLNKKSLEALTMCGAMDKLGERKQIIENTAELLKYSKDFALKPQSQDSLFGNDSALAQITLQKTKPATLEEKLAWEKELLGLYISGHPLDKFRQQLLKSRTNLNKIKKETIEGTTTVVAGIVEECKPIITRKGDKMAFVKLSDFSDTLEVVVFPKIYTEFLDLLQVEKCVLIKGKISKRNEEVSLIAESVRELK